MAITISVGIQKGGSAKSTTSSILSYLLSQKYKVLAIDMDGQGNLTQLLTGVEDIYEFEGNTIWDALNSEEASSHIFQINENLHILPGDENINTLGPHFHIELPKQGKMYPLALKRALASVQDNYDYIIIDNPPALGELSICSLSASDFVVIMYETSKFCYSSLKSYLRTIEAVQTNINPELKIAGILRAMIDNRRSDNKYYADLVQEQYKDFCFKSIIQRAAVVGRLPAFGLYGNSEIKQIIKHYDPFYKELMKVVKPKIRR